MIIFVLTAEHLYTLRGAVKELPAVNVSVISYEELFAMRSHPRATYVFTDYDRLPMWRVREAAALYRRLRDSGFRVLNDPARIPSRYGLLRRLHDNGINDFTAYRVEEGVVPRRWPVLLRSEGDHDPPFRELFHSWDEVKHAIDGAVTAGMPLASLLMVEYAAEPVRPNLFRRLSVYRVGDVWFGATCVHEGTWLVKGGVLGIATPELYDDELRIVRDNPFRAAVEPAFALAEIEYGRIDFGLVGGKVQIYEINSNPTISFPTEHPSPARVESYRIYRQNFLDALIAIDSPEEASPMPQQPRRRNPFRRAYRSLLSRLR